MVVDFPTDLLQTMATTAAAGSSARGAGKVVGAQIGGGSQTAAGSAGDVTGAAVKATGVAEPKAGANVLPAQAALAWGGSEAAATKVQPAQAVPSRKREEVEKEPERASAAVTAQKQEAQPQPRTQSEMIIQTDENGTAVAAKALSQTLVGSNITGAEYITFLRDQNGSATLGMIRLLPVQMQHPYPGVKRGSNADARNMTSLLRDRSAGRNASRPEEAAGKPGGNAAAAAEARPGKKDAPGKGKGLGQGILGGCRENRAAPCKFFILVSHLNGLLSRVASRCRLKISIYKEAASAHG